MNVMYHAEADHVTISIKDDNKNIYLSIADDGKGFDLHQLKESPGLHSMNERAASIHGQLKINSKIGKGTTISVSIEKPLTT